MDIVVIRSNRRSFAIEIGRDKIIKVRVPKRASKAQIDDLLKKKQDWILRTLDKMDQRNEVSIREAEQVKELSSEEIKKLRKEARARLTELTERWANRIGVSYGNISIRGQKTRWGSCSSKKNLNFNFKLFFLPERLIDYVCVHELAHLKQMNHSKAFWEEVEGQLPDYRQRREELKRYI